jgi:hypothetical protein
VGSEGRRVGRGAPDGRQRSAEAKAKNRKNFRENPVRKQKWSFFETARKYVFMGVFRKWLHYAG